jgi:Ion channel
MTQASPGRKWPGGAVTAVPARRSPEGRYGALLLVLVASYLLSAFSGRRLGTELQIGLFVLVLLLALRTSPLARRHRIMLGAAAVIGSAAALGAALTDTDAGAGAAELWKGVILLLSAVLIVRRVLAKPTVTIQSIYGALSTYIIVGLMFAAYYAAIGRLGGAPFFADHQPADTQTYQYFSFTTLTTLGYGDFTAAGNGGRALAVMEALSGQIFLATLVARLVAAFRAPGEPPAPSDRDSPPVG